MFDTSHPLYKLLSSHASISDAAWNYLTSHAIVKKLKPGEYVVRPGDERRVAYIEKGLLRQFVISDNGKEQNMDFCCENEFTGDINPLAPGYDDYLWIEALEDSSLVLISSATIKHMVDVFPEASLVMVKILLPYFDAKCDKEAYIHFSNAKDAYSHFLNRYPGLENRISLRHIASYLGISPETLSRLRK